MAQPRPPETMSCARDCAVVLLFLPVAGVVHNCIRIRPPGRRGVSMDPARDVDLHERGPHRSHRAGSRACIRVCRYWCPSWGCSSLCSLSGGGAPGCSSLRWGVACGRGRARCSLFCGAERSLGLDRGSTLAPGRAASGGGRSCARVRGAPAVPSSGVRSRGSAAALRDSVF